MAGIDSTPFFQIQGNKIVVQAGQTLSVDKAKEAVAAAGVQVPDSAFPGQFNYTEAQINATIKNYSTTRDFVSATFSVNQEQVENQLNEISELADEVKSGIEPDLNSIINSSTQSVEYTMEEARSLLANYDKNIANLEQQVKDLTDELVRLKQELEVYQEEYQTAKQNKEQQEANYSKLESQYSANQSKYSKIESSIETATKNAADDVKNKQQAAIYKAMSEYDETKDGAYETYLTKALAKANIDTSASSQLIKNLQSEAMNIQSELGKLKTDMSVTQIAIQNFTQQMSTAEAKVNAKGAEVDIKTSMQVKAASELSDLQNNIGKIALASISPEEKALVSKNNIDLTAKFEDGSPKFILAMGRSDNLYHIYEMDGPCGKGATSLARKYAPGKGFNIVAIGNGSIHDMKDTEACGISNKVISLNCVNSDMTECQSDSSQRCYTTCSPLSLDMNGDGVKTSDTLIQYDIDGDGELDTINDAADAVLVFDADGDGNSGSSGLECFGNNTDLDGDGKPDGFKDGFQALKAFAQREGLISENDSILDAKDIKYLEENFGFKVKMGGYNDEAVSLLEAGVTQIDLAQGETTNLMKNFDGQNNDIMTQEGATFTVNGEKHEYADLWHAKK